MSVFAEAAELLAATADDPEETGALLGLELTAAVEAALDAASELLPATADEREETIASLHGVRQLVYTSK